MTCLDNYGKLEQLKKMPSFGNISFKLVLLTPGAKPHINSLFERIFGDISSCKACSCAD